MSDKTRWSGPPLSVDQFVNFIHLDEMTEQAFDDQCTGANPRYPLISEMREMYLTCYYGRKNK